MEEGANATPFVTPPVHVYEFAPLPVSVTLVPAQTTDPVVLAVTDGVGLTLIFTVSVEAGQTPLLMLQTKLLMPVPNEVSVVDGEFTDVMVPVPEINDHVPVPIPGLFAVKVAVFLQSV